MSHQKKTLTMATYNVHGLAVNTGGCYRAYQSQETRHSGTYGNMDATGAVLPIRGKQFSAIPERLKKKGRNRGGVSVLFRSDLKARLLYKIVQQDHQVIAVRVAGLTVFGAYIAPGMTGKGLSGILKNIQSVPGERKVLIGDLNSRHTKWDTKANAKGRKLHSWCLNSGWTVAAPGAPTMRSHVGQSVVDIVVCKGIPAPSVQLAFGPWIGASDHIPITARVPCRCRKCRKTKEAITS